MTAAVTKPVLSAEAVRLHLAGQGDRSTLANLRDGQWLGKQVFPPLEFVVPGIIPEGLSLLIAPPKAGKSWLMLAVALAAASGGSALGVIPVRQRPVLYAALEDSDRRMQARCRTLLGDGPIPAGFHYVTKAEPGTVLHLIQTWLAEHRTTAPPVVILDTLGKVMPDSRAGESAYQRDYRIGGHLKALCDAHRGTALIVVHHLRKAASADFVDGVSGTHGLAGAADSVLVLDRPRGHASGVLKVTGRDIEEAEYAVTLFQTGVWNLQGLDLKEAAGNAAAARATAGLGDRAADIIRYVTDHPNGVRRAEIAAAMKLDPDTVSVYLSRAIKSGRLAKDTRGLYTPVCSVGCLDQAS